MLQKSSKVHRGPGAWEGGCVPSVPGTWQAQRRPACNLQLPRLTCLICRGGLDLPALTRSFGLKSPMFPSTDVTAVCSVGGGEGEEGEENAYFLIHCCIRAISPALDRDRHPQGGASIKTRVASLVSAAEMFLNGVGPWGHLSSSQQILFPGNCQREGTLQECLYNVTLLRDTVTGPIRYISCKNLVLGPRDMGSVSRLELVTMAPMQTNKKKKSERPYAWAWMERNRDESWKERAC